MPAQPKSLRGAHARLAVAEEARLAVAEEARADGERESSGGEIGGERGVGDDGVGDGTGVSGRAGSAAAVKPKQYQTRAKASRLEKKADKQAAEEEAAYRNVEVVLPSFTQREYADYDAFEEALKAYAVDNFVSLRTRHSLGRTYVNDKREKVHQAEIQALAQWISDREKGTGDPDAEEPTVTAPLLIPENGFPHSVLTLRCTHGIYQAPRGAGDRFAAATRYTGCQARLSADAAYDCTSNTWKVVLSKENTVHNHSVSKSLFGAYLNASMVDNQVLYDQTREQVAVGGNGRLIRDRLSIALRRTYTARQYDNLKNYHLTPGLAAANFQMLIDRFCELDEARCLIIEDEADVVSGIVFQTGLQREMFQLYGDSLILDWTHNTNNAGFYLGSLLATSATGKGVPVLNFLCLSQGKEMMKTILQYFLDENPGAKEKIQSVVIDKDYAEWKAIEEVCTESVVVLCQFHVLKWLKQVIRDPKYAIEASDLATVSAIIRGMVYSESKDEFVRLQHELRALLSRPEHGIFHEYLETRWYTCKKMWANYKRGQVYTAGNPTSNRLESHWKEVKSVLGKRRRMDLCFEAVIIRETAIVRRELAEFVEHAVKIPLRSRAPEFLRPALRRVASSRALLVEQQWTKYMARPSSYVATSVSRENGSYSVRVGGVDFSVSTASWSCSCRFAVSHQLPCRHQLFVAHRALHEPYFPMSAIHPRWRMDVSMDLIHRMKRCVEELETVRIAQVVADLALSQAVDSEASDEPVSSQIEPEGAQPVKRATFVKLRRREVSHSVVLDDMGKREVVLAQFSQLLTHMMGLGTQRFWETSTRLETALTAFLESETAAMDAAEYEAVVEADLVALDYSAEPVEPDDDAGFDEEDAGVVGVVHEVPFPPSLLASTHGIRFPDLPSETMDANISALLAEIDDMTDAGNGISGDLVATSIGERLLAPESGPAFTLQPFFSSFPTEKVGADGFEGWQFDPSTSAAGSSVPTGVSRASEPGDQARSGLAAGGHEGMEDARRVERTAVPVAMKSTANAPTTEIKKSTWPRRNESWVGTPALNTRGAKRKAALPGVEEERAEKARVVDTRRDSAPEARDKCMDADRTQPPTSETVRGPTRMKLPAAKRTPRQRKQQASVTGRVAVIEGRSDCPVIVEDAVLALKHLRLGGGLDMIASYPELFTDTIFRSRFPVETKAPKQSCPVTFSVPKVVADKLIAALNEKRASGSTSDKISVDEECSTAFKFPGLPYIFPESSIRAQVEFHDVKGRLARYRRDHVWLQKDDTWRSTESAVNPSFLALYGDECVSRDDKLGVTQMRALTLASLDAASLETHITVQQAHDEASAPRASVSVPVSHVLGRFSNNVWLNDTIVNFALHLIASQYDDVVVIDSLNHGQMRLPTKRLDKQRLVVFPLNYECGEVKHWCVICVLLEEGRPSTVYMYDPLFLAMWKTRMEASWRSWCGPLLQRWHSRDNEADKSSIMDGIVERWVSQPRQSDGYNCGVYCIAQAASYMTTETDFAWQDMRIVAPSALLIMRLRLMYMFLCKAAKTSNEDASLRAEETSVAVEVYARSHAVGGAKGKATR